MTPSLFYNIVLIVWLAIAALTFFSLLFITAPYGRHTRGGWGPQVSDTLGWLIMEIPAVLAISVFFFLSDRTSNPVSILFLLIWQIHYFNRGLIFPFRRRSKGKTMPLSIALSGLFFNIVNGYLQGYLLFFLLPAPSMAWLSDPRFLGGTLLFLVGFAINQHSDQILFNLRKPGETGYKIPTGGMYRFVSNPNYFGELLEWTGWAILTCSVGGLAFVIWTAANLIPRALSNHKWYKDKFKDYPKSRKAVVPFVL